MRAIRGVVVFLLMGAMLCLSNPLTASVNEATPAASHPTRAVLTHQKLSADPCPQKARLPPSAVDLESLTQRLRATKAIGHFTKLALKQKVDTLIEAFSDFHNGASTISLSLLRNHYNNLVNHILNLLCDEDAELHTELAASREALWRLLADPAQFATR